jgi:hypothetical protein
MIAQPHSMALLLHDRVFSFASETRTPAVLFRYELYHDRRFFADAVACIS